MSLRDRLRRRVWANGAALSCPRELINTLQKRATDGQLEWLRICNLHRDDDLGIVIGVESRIRSCGGELSGNPGAGEVSFEESVPARPCRSRVSKNDC